MVWNFVARRLVANQWLMHKLYTQAFKRPYFDLFNSDGSPYMRRWWLVPLSWKLPFSIRIHHIQSADEGRDLHDHPANYRTIILRGAYLERLADGSKRIVGEGQTIKAKATHFHRIEDVTPGGVWTMFIMGRWQHTWGFKVAGTKVAWRIYLRQRGFDV
jgi:hypothetical protein